ncbi:nuclear transport factor 2 family protein [Streptosporangium sp. NPDC051022]|uniref:nuclear transport factor 2 family protein n=1 Tax=Streptosporangium sp. NPDC051022 TaxID=3155752 RepID=UPI0034399DA4
MSETDTEITRRIQELADRAAVLDVVNAYAMALDTRDWEALGELFTEDALWEYRGAAVYTLSGRDAVVTRARAALEPLDATQHLNGNNVVKVRGDEAEHTGYVHAQHVRHGLPGGELYLGGVRYQDRLRRTSDGWRFTHRLLVHIWGEGNPAVFGREAEG